MEHDGTLSFETQTGTLTVTKDEAGALVMDFPQGQPFKVSCDDEMLSKQIVFAVGLPTTAKVLEMWQCNRTRKLTLIVDRPDAIGALAPDQNAIKALRFPDGWNVKGIIVANSDPSSKYDFVSRYFAPMNGIPEDPVTGSAHTVLAVIFGQRLGKTKMVGFQKSMRGGQVGVELVGDSRVKLFGKAITMLDGWFYHL